MRLNCKGCGHDWVPRPKPSKGQRVYCPECGKLIFEYSKPLHPFRAKALRGTGIDEYGRKDNR